MSGEGHPIPWEDRPPGSTATLWRSSQNPIIDRDHLPRSNSIFNSAVVPFEDGFAGVFRVDDTARTMNIHSGLSADGIDWQIDEQPIVFTPADGRVAEIQGTFLHAYDPRVTWLKDRYFVTWCNGYQMVRRSGLRSPTISERSTNSTTPTSPSTGTACCSLAGSATGT